MRTRWGLRTLGLFVVIGVVSAWGQAPMGTIVGLLRSSTQTPIRNATVTATKQDGSSIRSTISGSDGLYSFADLPVGSWSVSVQADGFAAKIAGQVEVVGGQAARTDLLLASAGAVNPVSPTPVNPQPMAPGTPVSPVVAPTPVSVKEGSEAKPKKIEPFSDWDWSWLNGTPRTHDSPLDSKYFTGEFRADTHFALDFNQPKDDSLGGSSEIFRSSEVQLEQISLGGDLHVDNVRGRIMTMFGMFATTTPRNDASPSRGQWQLDNAYRYVSEAWGGYHWNKLYGINLDAGIFVSYIGLFSYYNFDNWAYQPSYVSSNTPWFFNGVRLQIYPTKHLKIEPWLINGWQAYGRPNGRPGLGGQIRWTPKPWLNIVSNNYGLGQDAVGIPGRSRVHTDNSVEVKYYDNAERYLDKMAFTFTGDMGCEYGAGVTCHGGKAGPKQSFLGYMLYNRFWFHNDLWAMTLGGGQINNPGRYLVLLPPINGATAASGTPYFPETPGLPFKAYDATATFDYMPKQYITFRSEFGYRHANVPYFTGRQGITPPMGNTGTPGSAVILPDGSTWNPDLRRSQPLLIFAVMVKF
jgi:hypothetical protein